MQTTERITVTLPRKLAEKIRQMVASGEAESVSALVASTMEERFRSEDVKEWLAAMEAVGGKPTQEDREWADALMRAARGE